MTHNHKHVYTHTHTHAHMHTHKYTHSHLLTLTLAFTLTFTLRVTLTLSLTLIHQHYIWFIDPNVTDKCNGSFLNAIHSKPRAFLQLSTPTPPTGLCQQKNKTTLGVS